MKNKKILAYALSISILFSASTTLNNNNKLFKLEKPYNFEEKLEEEKELKKSRK